MKKLWFIIVIVLVVVAVVLAIVFINLFTSKNTEALAKTVNSYTQSGYLSADNSGNQAIDSYLASLTSLTDLQDDLELIENYSDAFEAFEVIGEFYNRQIVFTDYTSSYKSNRKKIEKDFKNAQSIVDEFEAYLAENLPAIGNNQSWLAISWVTCKEYMEDIISYTSDAFTRLAEVYQNSVTSKVLNNDLTDIIFEYIDTQLTQLNDEEGVQTADIGKNLLTFANAYLTLENENIILGYMYDDKLQTKVEDIKENGEESSYYGKFIEGSISA